MEIRISETSTAIISQSYPTAINTSLLHVDYDKYNEFDKEIRKRDVFVKPLLIQDEDTKVVVWELEEDSEFKKIPEIKKVSQKEEKKDTKAAAPAVSGELDDVAKTVIECAATAYEVDASAITLATDIREELSNESMKMIVMISEIEDNLDVTIEIQEASTLMTIADFVNVVRERI